MKCIAPLLAALLAVACAPPQDDAPGRFVTDPNALPSEDGGVARIAQAWTATPNTFLTIDFTVNFSDPADAILSKYARDSGTDTFLAVAHPAEIYVQCPSLQVTVRTAVSADPTTLVYDGAVGPAVSIGPMSVPPYTTMIRQCAYHVPTRAIPAGDLYLWFVPHCLPGDAMLTVGTPYWSMIHPLAGQNVHVGRSLPGFFGAKSWWRSHFGRCGNGADDVWWDDGATIQARHCTSCPICNEGLSCNVVYGPASWQ